MKTFKIHRVLVPLDFSSVAANALRTAMAICKRHQAAMTILHVVENNYPMFAPSAAMGAGTILPRLVGDAKANLNKLAFQLMRKHGILVRHVVQSGNPADEICKTAYREKHSLIVMGTEENSGWSNFFIGSTPYRVIKNAHCPVLTVPAGNSTVDFRKILFPVRRVPKALEKYLYLRPIAKANAASIHVAGIVRKNDQKSFDEINAQIRFAKHQMDSDDVECGTDMHFTENEAQLVLQLSKMENPDLVVITATPDVSLKEFFLGPYAQDVVNNAHCPVLSVRPRKEPEMPESNVLFSSEPLAAGG